MTEETLKIIISAEIGKLKEELNKGKQEVENFKNDTKGSFDEFANIANTAGESAKTALVGFAGAVVGVGASLLALTASTEEYREGQAKLSTAFETAGGSAETAKKVYNDLYRVLGKDDTAIEASAHLAKLTTNQAHLAEWTKISQGIYATFGDSLPIEGMTEAVNHTVKLGAVQGTLADALEWAGVSADEVNERLSTLSTEAEKEAYLRELLNGLYNEASANYEVNAEKILAQHEAEAKLAEQTAKIGEALAPVNAMLTELGADILSQIAPQIEEFMNTHGEELRLLLVGIGEAIGVLIGWIVDNWENITEIGTVILIIVTAVYALSTAVSIYATVQAIANTQMLAVYAVILLIIAIVGVFVVYWDDIKVAMTNCAEALKKAWENMGSWFSNIAEEIKQGFEDFGNWFSNIFNTAKNAITNAFSPIGNWFKNIANTIRNAFSNIGSFFGNVFSQAVNNIKNAFSSITQFFRNIYNSIGEMFTNIGTKVSEGLVSGIKKAVNSVLKNAVNVINTAIAGVNGAIDFMNLIPGVNISKVREMNVPKLEKGGVIDTATLAMFGENGAEAVIPLENNLQWLDKLANLLSVRMGSNAPVVLQVDGKTFAEISVNSINQLTKQKGTLPLKLV